MALSSEYLNDKGQAGCVSCRKTTNISNLETCVICDRFVCKDCATYRRQGSPYGYVCPRCVSKIKIK